MLHNRYKIQGGEDVSTEAEFNLLKNNGIDIQSLYVTNDQIDKTSKLSLALNTIWSNKHYKEILGRVKAGQFDLVHVQNFFPIFSPSIFYAARKSGAKVVMSVRNYRLICPNALMYVNDNICNDCVGRKLPHPSVFKKCYRESLSATGTTAVMLGIHNLMDTWRSQIDGLICISEFVKSQLILGNFDENKLHVKYNFVSTTIPPEFSPEDYYIYVGRISTEKGIDVLLNAFAGSGKRLIIIGDGPLNNLVEQSATQNSNIEFLGKLPLSETYNKIARAKALIFPSKWHEPFGRTIVESFGHGTPVIGSSLGGVTELVRDGFNGYLFNPYQPESLTAAIDKFENEAGNQMRTNAYESYKTNFSPESNFQQLVNIYNKIINN
jgi:glycosyltransferase involved in cell wall biosynthesis